MSKAIKRLLSRQNGLIIVVALAVLAISTFGAWKFQQLFSPNSGPRLVGDKTYYQLKISDRNFSDTTLNNEIVADPPAREDRPKYGYTINNGGPTYLTVNSNKDYQLFRIQGEVLYYEK